MRVTHRNEFGAGAGLTVTESARRAQIIAATIRTLAELGYRKTSFARIVERAGLSSTRMISYHFGTKDELMLAVVGEIVDHQDTFLAERLGSGNDRAGMLRAYITSEVAFLGAFPQEARALWEIGTNARDASGTPLLEHTWKTVTVGRLQRQLAQGQREGAFGTFDVEVMALAIRQAIDGVAGKLAQQPELDLAAYGEELAGLFVRATAPEQARQ